MSIFKIPLLFLASSLPFSCATASQKIIQSTPGCGNAYGDLSEPLTIESNGVQRQFLVYVPESYQEEQATGLILSFHGYGKDMWNQQEISRFNDSTFNPDMIAVFPQGLNGTEGKSAWEGVPRAAPNVQDKRFTTDLLTYLRDNFCIDDSRIYASGKSDGGGFVGTLACSPDHSGDFAAFAAASGAFYTDASDASPCYPARSPLPILEFHGTADEVIPYVGGYRHKTALPSIPDWLARWAGDERNDCSVPMSNVTEDGDRVWHTTYLCDGMPMVQGFLVEGMAHDWPSKEYNDDNKGKDFAPIEGTSIMMDFFRNNTKPLVGQCMIGSVQQRLTKEVNLLKPGSMATSKAWAVIAGVGPGTGASVARKFALKYPVALLARNPANYEPLIKEIEAVGGKAIGISTDVADGKSVANAFEKIKAAMNGAQLAAAVFNVGGKFIRKPFLELNEDDFMAGMEANGKGAFHFAQACLPLLLEATSGEYPPTLIFTSATAAMKGSAFCSSFATGKFAMRALAQSLAREFGPKGIHVAHAIIDGVIDIERTKDWKFDAPDAKISPHAIADSYWYLHTQPRTCFTNELDIRPYIEKW